MNRLIAACLAGWLAANTCSAAVIQVPADQPSIAAAVAVASSGDLIVVQQSIFGAESIVDFTGKALRIDSVGSIQQAPSGVIRMAASSSLNTAPGGQLALGAELRSGVSGTADVACGTLSRAGEGRVVVLAGATLNLAASNATLGAVRVESGAALSVGLESGDLTLLGPATLLDGSSLFVAGPVNATRAVIATNATIAVDRQLLSSWQWSMTGGLLQSGESVTNGGGRLMVLDDVVVSAATLLNFGDMRLLDGFVVAGRVENHADTQFLGTTIIADEVFNDLFASATGYGDWNADLANAGSFDVLHESSVLGNVSNDGTLRVLEGALSIIGSLLNTGTIIGDVNTMLAGAAPVSFSITGDFVTNEAASLLLGSTAHTLRVDGNFDAAIISNSAYDMRLATLRVGSLSGSTPTLEVMSTDIGPSPRGLDRTLPGHFPIGTLHVAATTVSLTDARDNDGLGQTACEALYVDTLRIDAGATLDNASCRVFYNTRLGAGDVTNPDNLLPYLPSLPGDLNCDGAADVLDINPFVLALSDAGAYATAFPNCDRYRADVNGDGEIDVLDINAFVQLLMGG